MKYRTGRLCRIRMELVAQIGHPRGERATGYELQVPLNPDGHIDATSWLDEPGACHVRCFRRGSVDKNGILARTPRGRWYFDYGSSRDVEHDQRLNEDRFIPGQFIPVYEEDGKLRTYRVTSVEAVAVPS